jgi:hypothetical protein
MSGKGCVTQNSCREAKTAGFLIGGEIILKRAEKRGTRKFDFFFSVEPISPFLRRTERMAVSDCGASSGPNGRSAKAAGRNA